jgi:D-3-phosphoglycerate dehydrogenase
MSSKGTILIADYDYGDVDIERSIIEGGGFDLRAEHCKTQDDLIRVGRDADGVLAQYADVGSQAIDAFTRCRVIARYGTGVDIVDVDAATRRNIQVTNAPSDWCASEVADHAIALWLTAARRICQYNRATHRDEWRWQTGQPIWRLRDRVFGLLSFGAIAKAIAARAQPFEVDVWAHDPFTDQEDIKKHQVRPVSFDELLEGSDFLVIQAPLTPETHHLFNRETLRRMKPTALLINTARGPIVEDAALYQALTEGWISGAAVDDLEEEPAKQTAFQSKNNPLFGLPNVLVTPHAAYYSEESIATVRRIAAEEAVRVLSGQPPRYPVNRVGKGSRVNA